MHPLRVPLSVTEDADGIEISGRIPPVDSWDSATAHTMDSIPRGPGCYALFRKEELIYIGESDCLAERLKGHNVQFDRCAWLRLDGAQRFLVEKMLIWHRHPEDNRELKRHDYRMMLKKEALNA